MHQVKQEFGKLSPNAPTELTKFAFLIGNWNFEARVKIADGHSQNSRNVARSLHSGRLCDFGRIPDDRFGRKADRAGVESTPYDADKQAWNIMLTR